MILINFGHPLSAEHLRELEAQVARPVERLLEVAVQLDPQAPFAAQVTRLVDEIGLSPREWQGEAIVINPPTLNVAAAALLAELHGRMGYFPPVVRLRPAAGSLPPRFQVAEVIDLRALRDGARARRLGQEVGG